MPRGGRRPGAGRPRKAQSERRATFRPYLPAKLQERIRAVAPGMGVATWITQAIEQALANEENRK